MRTQTPSTGISTRRTTLRPLTYNDLEDIMLLHHDPITRKFAWVENLQTIDENRNWIEDQRLLEQDGYGFYAVVSRGTNAFIGLCGLRVRNDMDRIIDLSYRILPAFRQRGFGTEAAESMLLHGFQDLHLPAIYTQVHKDNFASRRIMYRLGFEAIQWEKSWILYRRFR